MSAVWDLIADNGSVGGKLATSVVIAAIAAGLVIALQDLISALAGWFNITVGGIFRVGDRVQLGGVRGDVIDVTPRRTNLMEIGAHAGPGFPGRRRPSEHHRTPFTKESLKGVRVRYGVSLVCLAIH
jgi:small-conductance mechanosensitive channel